MENSQTLGDAKYIMGKFDEAIALYDTALRLDNRNEIAMASKGEALMRLGLYDEAIKYFDTAISLDTKYAEAWNGKGVALGRLGRYEDAIQCYDQALDAEILPGSATVFHCHPGKSLVGYFFLGNSPKADTRAPVFLRVRTTNPESTNASPDANHQYGSYRSIPKRPITSLTQIRPPAACPTAIRN